MAGMAAPVLRGKVLLWGEKGGWRGEWDGD